MGRPKESYRQSGGEIKGLKVAGVGSYKKTSWGGVKTNSGEGVKTLEGLVIANWGET